MKILYKKGDIIRAPEQLIAHGCNAQGVMGAGVAKVLCTAWPLVFEEYKLLYEQFGLKLGSVHYVPIYQNKRGQLWVANCITQEFYGRAGVFVNYEAIESCISDVDIFCEKHDIDAFALPKIGAGLAGGDWNRIASIIEEVTLHATPVVYYLDD